MKITKKIWLIEHNNDTCWNEPIIKYSAKEAEDYVRNEFNSILADFSDYKNYWYIDNGTGTASIFYANEYYDWRITEHEIKFNV